MANCFWYQKKANALAEAWHNNYGAVPPVNAVVLALSVAIHETRAGDAWPGPDGIVGTDDDEHNWGATTLRALNAAERAAVKAAGVSPSVGPGHEQRAKAAQAAIVAAGLPLPQGTIHCDSAPSIGPYFVWFAAFHTDVDGAAYFLKLLAGLKTPKMARAVLLSPHGSETGLAAAMYAAGYYTGFHKKKSTYARIDGRWRELKAGETAPEGSQTKQGSELNIAAYAGALQRISPTVRKCLENWLPKTPEPEPEPEPEKAPTDPPPPPPSEPPPASMIPLEVDWDEVARARDAIIREMD